MNDASDPSDEPCPLGAPTCAALARELPVFEEEGLEGPILNLIQALIGEAHARGADRVQFEPCAERLVVRMRCGGEMSERLSLDPSWARPLTARLKLMAALDLRERLRPQRGRARVRRGDDAIELVLVTAPLQHGEATTLELRATACEPALDVLGLDPVDNARLHALGLERGGLLLVLGGSTASRAATLHALERELADARDPALDVRRADELEDPAAARRAARAALSGATLLAGVRAEDAADAVARLFDLALEPFVVALALRGVLLQRELPRLCDACREPMPLAPELRMRLHLADDRDVFRSAGCAACDGTGVVGRVALLELTTFDDEVRECIRSGTRGPALRAALACADDMLARRALELALAGRAAWRDVLPLVSGEAA